MRIEIKSNQIVVEFSEKETKFIGQKAAQVNIEGIAEHIKSKVIEALALEELEDVATSNLGSDFNLDKIKNVTDELKKRKEEIGNDRIRGDNLQKSKEANKKVDLTNNSLIPDKKSDAEGKEADEEAMEIGDDLLASLLDQDLLKGSQKPEKSDQ